MASYGYSKYVGGDCGASPESPASNQCVGIAECSKGIKGHLRACSVSESALNSEERLLLARAGTLYSFDYILMLYMCTSNNSSQIISQSADMFIIADYRYL